MVMHALANRKNCSLELLKITAVGTSTNRLEETDQWLSSFANSMNLPFSFKIVLSEMKDVKKDMFKLEGDEVVAVFLKMCLWSLLSCPNHLKILLRVIKGLNPCVVMVTEVEANTNTSSFMHRFYEALVLFNELSPSSLSQANLLINRSGCLSFCTLNMNGKSIIVNWKGTPMLFLSAWKLQCD
ncbi:unnamed protein product [Fraxinus pennsylvanica]|uniref:DELLA protein n=1 Tax=Fraxinus pennsylvanica TaxID=56036 RepID=A0AAD1ZNH4_9LAMI|nr:unnamed protein product [Fraxinus pennsylvanica]